MLFAVLQVALIGECLKNWRAGIQLILDMELGVRIDKNADTS